MRERVPDQGREGCCLSGEIVLRLERGFEDGERGLIGGDRAGRKKRGKRRVRDEFGSLLLCKGE
jgi:hypothetical protein